MKNTYITLLLSLTFLTIIQTQECRDNRGWRVDWWIMLTFPDSVSTGFAYFDSRFAAPTLAVFTQQPDTVGTPLTRTLDQIANFNMHTLAWNDQTPTGVQSSTRAHSKSIAAYNSLNQTGLMIIHSIPRYANFTGKLINITIDISQQKFGQHLMCISGDKTLMVRMINKILPIRPLTYAPNYDCSTILSDVLHVQNTVPDYNSLFSYMNYERNGTQMNFIFKNGFKNSSIFQDGINNMLNSSLLSQTWGRPLQLPWCGSQYASGNIKEIQVNQNITWATTQDHSKWTVAVDSNHSCFGDMNRMQSQWARGGAFYCIKSQLLNQALKSIIKTSEGCAQA